MYWNYTDVASGQSDTARLTLTWDVLKLIAEKLNEAMEERLTLTWDVLKFIFAGAFLGYVAD